MSWLAMFTIEYRQKADGSFEPRTIHSVVICTLRAEPLKAKPCKEAARYTGPDETPPIMANILR
jgi:hypothetical protein